LAENQAQYAYKKSMYFLNVGNGKSRSARGKKLNIYKHTTMKTFSSKKFILVFLTFFMTRKIWRMKI